MIFFNLICDIDKILDLNDAVLIKNTGPHMFHLDCLVIHLKAQQTISRKSTGFDSKKRSLLDFL